MKKIEDYRNAAIELHNKLHFSTHPVAIKYIKDKSEIPKTALWPSKAGFKLALCQALTHVRRNGGLIAMTTISVYQPLLLTAGPISAMRR